MELLSKKNPRLPEIRNDVQVYKQKPIKTYDFNETGERIEKRKLNRREVAENNNKLLKKYKKQEENKKRG